MIIQHGSAIMKLFILFHTASPFPKRIHFFQNVVYYHRIMKSGLAIIFLATTHLYGQSTNSFNVELGINSVGFSRLRTYGGGEEKITPSISPIFGFWSTRSLSKHAFSTLGIQYSGTGQMTVYHKDDIDRIQQASYSVDVEDKIRLKKISLIVGAGYEVHLRKFRIKPAIGVKSIYYTTGRYEHNYMVIENGTSTIVIKRKMNPFDDQVLNTSADRTNFEIWIVAEFKIGKSFSVVFGFSQPVRQIYFEERRPSYTVHLYSRGDLSLTLRCLVSSRVRQRNLKSA